MPGRKRMASGTGCVKAQVGWRVGAGGGGGGGLCSIPSLTPAPWRCPGLLAAVYTRAPGHPRGTCAAWPRPLLTRLQVTAAQLLPQACSFVSETKVAS